MGVVDIFPTLVADGREAGEGEVKNDKRQVKTNDCDQICFHFFKMKMNTELQKNETNQKTESFFKWALGGSGLLIFFYKLLSWGIKIT